MLTPGVHPLGFPTGRLCLLLFSPGVFLAVASLFLSYYFYLWVGVFFWACFAIDKEAQDAELSWRESS